MKPLLAAISLLVLIICFAVPAQAQQDGSYPAVKTLLLTPGHAQTYFFSVAGPLTANLQNTHLLALATLGAGTLTVRIGAATDPGEYANFVYGAAGMIGTQPVLRWAYNAETISISQPVGQAAVGLLLSGILLDNALPVYPMILSVVVSLL